MNRNLKAPAIAALLAAGLLALALLDGGPAVIRATPPAPPPVVIPYPRDADGNCGLAGARLTCKNLTGDEGLCRDIRRTDISPDRPGRCRLELALPAADPAA